MSNPGILTSNIMGSLFADIALLLIMLIGLFRLHFGSGAIGLERVLRNQVRWLRFLLWCSKFTDLIFIRKGLVWLLLAIVCEIPPAVCLCILLSPPSRSYLFHNIGVHMFAFER